MTLARLRRDAAARTQVEETVQRTEERFAHLLTRDDMQRHGLDYLEVGPAGWEHLMVIVSERPLITAAIMARTTAQMPFATLTAPEISDLVETLATEASDTWSAGTLSFLVG